MFSNLIMWASKTNSNVWLNSLNRGASVVGVATTSAMSAVSEGFLSPAHELLGWCRVGHSHLSGVVWRTEWTSSSFNSKLCCFVCRRCSRPRELSLLPKLRKTTSPTSIQDLLINLTLRITFHELRVIWPIAKISRSKPHDGVYTFVCDNIFSHSYTVFIQLLNHIINFSFFASEVFTQIPTSRF